MKAKIPIYALCILIIVVVQSTLLHYIKIHNVKPNLLIVFIVAVALMRGNIEGAAVGFFSGLLQDMLFGRIIGFYALLGMYLGLIVGSVYRRLYKENVLIVVFFTFVSTVVYEGLVYFFNSFGAIIDGQTDVLYAFKDVILPEAVYNSAVSIFMFIVVLKLHYRLEELSKAARKY